MEIKTVSVVDQSLLSRKRYALEISGFEITPKKDALKQEVAKKLNVEVSVLSLKGIHQHYGKKSASVNALVYSSPEELKRVEPKKKKEKKGAK